MNDRANPRLVRRCSSFTSASAVFAMVVGLSVLAGWTLHIALLLTWGAATTMAPNAAAASVLAGLALWLLRKRDDGHLAPVRKLAARVASAIVALVGLLSMAESLFDVDLGIDRLLLATAPAFQMTDAGIRVRMSPVAALVFLLLGFALLLIDWRTRRDDWPAQFLCLAAVSGAAFGLLGLVVGPTVSSITLALPAVLGYFALAFGIVCARSPWALGGLLTSDSQGARLLRKTVPAGLLVLSLIGWLISKPLLTEAHFTWMEVSALAILCSTMLAGFLAWIAFIVDRGDNERKKLETALHIDKEQIDRLLDRIDEPQAEVTLRRKVTVGFAVAVILTGLLGFLSWRMAQQSADDADWVAHTHQVLTTLELTLRHLVDVESGGRGFALTGSEPFLEPYEAGKYAIAQDLLRMHFLIVDTNQQRRLETLEQQANVRIESARNVVTIRQKTGQAPTEAQLERGKQLMDAARATIAEMEDAERGLLERRTGRARGAQRFNLSFIALGALAGVIFLSVAGATVSREISISARARAQVNALNADLERRVAQRTEALGESEGRLAGIIQSATDSIITVDEEQRVVLFNNTAERVFRCSAAEALGQPIARFIPQRFQGAHAGHIRTFGDTGVTNRIMGPRGVLWAVRADGEEFQIEASISQVVTGGKKLFTVILRDVTDRMLATEARERLAAIVDSSDDAIISKTLKGVITAWNHGAEKIFGYSASEAVGQPMAMLIPPERANEEPEILTRIARGVSVEHFETVRMRKDGQRIDVSVTISPIRDNNGVITGASKVARDISGRKQVEAALRESENRFRTLIEQASDAFFLHDDDGRFLEVNREACRGLGYTREELLRMRVFDVEQEIGMREAQQAREQSEPGKAYTLQGHHRRKDGTAFPVETRLSSYYVDGQKLHLGLVRDITERKQAEEALLEQAQVMDSAQVFVRDMESRVVFWPKGAEKLYGFTSQEALGILSHDLFQTQFPEPLETIEKKLFETGMWEGELIHRKRNGGTIIVSSAWVLHRDRQGRPVRILETNIDITASRQAAEELSVQSEELARSRAALEAQTLTLHSVLDSIAEGLVAADEQGKFILWNAAAKKIVGLGPTDLSSQDWSQHYGVFLPDTVTPFPPEDNPLARAIRGESGTAEMFLRNRELPQGIWIHASANPLRDKAGVLHGGVIAFRDVTQQKADERQIRQLNDELEIRVLERTAQLEAANKELEAFSYSVSHDLRAPLRHISGFSQMLVEELGPDLKPDALRYLERIQAGTQKMGLLVDELLNLARVGRHALNRRPTKLNAIVTEVIAMLESESQGRRLDWAIDDLPTVDCDPTLVKQIFQNLLANALKFTRPRTHTIIEISQLEKCDAGQRVFIVRDNGIGFSMKYVDKLFGVFQRLHLAGDFEGTGIGLATVQRIVQKHGGRVWAEGEVDKGATFYFTLGLEKEAESKSTGAKAGGQS
jgi:PAS domain S-box-containing protein